MIMGPRTRNGFRAAFAVVGGVVAWIVAATLGNLLLRALLPGYAGVEKAMEFTVGMMIWRLAIGAGSSIAAGAACAAIGRDARLPVYVLALLLVALFIPVHLNLWPKFPIWYHLFFLGTLAPLVILGGRSIRPATSRTASP